jgi:diguanylate cyclase (GGDEF)-like protein
VVIALTIVLRFYRTARSQELATTALRELADHDQLTGAANRELLRRRLPEFITGHRGLLVYLDLDGFKILNDTHGHHVGDAILCAVTRRLGDRVRSGDTIARIGGDEFVLLLHGCGDDEAPAIAQRILDDVRAPVTVDSLAVTVGASIGVVVLERPETPGLGADQRGLRLLDGAAGLETLTEDVMRSADTAMYDVKRQGGGFRIVRFDGDLLAAS